MYLHELSLIFRRAGAAAFIDIRSITLEGKGNNEKGLIGVVRLKKENETQGRKYLAAQ